MESSKEVQTMTRRTHTISEGRCVEWRVSCKQGREPYEISVEEGVPRDVVLQHAFGECQHAVEEEPLTLKQYRVGVEECEDIRSQYDDNSSIEEVMDETGRGWKTLVLHLTGECSHDEEVSEPTFTRQSILRHSRVTADDCERFRRGVQEAENVMDFADTEDTRYPVILAHVNGECSHDIDVPPRDVEDRSRVSREECQRIRHTYRSDSRVELSDLAEEHDFSRGTIERHVKFHCSHPPDDGLVTKIDSVQDILRNP
jgi:5-methylcytosine-specific restriction protein A